VTRPTRGCPTTPANSDTVLDGIESSLTRTCRPPRTSEPCAGRSARVPRRRPLCAGCGGDGAASLLRGDQRGLEERWSSSGNWAATRKRSSTSVASASICAVATPPLAWMSRGTQRCRPPGVMLPDSPRPIRDSGTYHQCCNAKRTHSGGSFPVLPNPNGDVRQGDSADHRNSPSRPEGLDMRGDR